MKFKKKSNFINFFHIKQIVVKRIETKLEEKTNWRAALKIWRAKHGNQGGERKKKQEKVASAKQEVHWPHMLPRYGKVVEAIQTPP
jgi:hypothetical protein